MSPALFMGILLLVGPTGNSPLLRSFPEKTQALFKACPSEPEKAAWVTLGLEWEDSIFDDDSLYGTDADGVLEQQLLHTYETITSVPIIGHITKNGLEPEESPLLELFSTLVDLLEETCDQAVQVTTGVQRAALSALRHVERRFLHFGWGGRHPHVLRMHSAKLSRWRPSVPFHTWLIT